MSHSCSPAWGDLLGQSTEVKPKESTPVTLTEESAVGVQGFHGGWSLKGRITKKGEKKELLDRAEGPLQAWQPTDCGSACE